MEHIIDSDDALVQRFQSGDISAFDGLVNRHYARVYRLAAIRMTDENEAFDVAQDVFLRAFTALPTFRRDATFYTWVYRVTHNVCVDYARKRTPIPTDRVEEGINDELSSTVCGSATNPIDEVLHHELNAKLCEAIARLPGRQRKVFELRTGGMKLSDIAERVNRSVGTVKAHLSHARGRLHGLMQAYYIGIE